MGQPVEGGTKSAQKDQGTIRKETSSCLTHTKEKRKNIGNCVPKKTVPQVATPDLGGRGKNGKTGEKKEGTNKRPGVNCGGQKHETTRLNVNQTKTNGAVPKRESNGTQRMSFIGAKTGTSGGKKGNMKHRCNQAARLTTDPLFKTVTSQDRKESSPNKPSKKMDTSFARIWSKGGGKAGKTDKFRQYDFRQGLVSNFKASHDLSVKPRNPGFPTQRNGWGGKGQSFKKTEKKPKNGRGVKQNQMLPCASSGSNKPTAEIIPVKGKSRKNLPKKPGLWGSKIRQRFGYRRGAVKKKKTG